MDEEVNVGVGERWHAWRGAGAAGLPRNGQGDPAQRAEDSSGTMGMGMGMAKAGWDTSPGSWVIVQKLASNREKKKMKPKKDFKV